MTPITTAALVAALCMMEDRTMTSNDLLPCPFCGSAEVSQSTGARRDGSSWHYVECEDCGANTEPDVWNHRATPAPVVTEEEALCREILAELTRTRTKFPGKNVTFAALVNEVGELATATFDEGRDRVRKEAIQVAVMAMRMILDGDHCFDAWRHEKGLDPLTNMAISTPSTGQPAVETKSALREITEDLIEQLASASSPYIPGSGPAVEWSAETESLISAARAALQTGEEG